MTQRVFIAFPVEAEVKRAISLAQTELKALNPRAHITWVKPEAMHVTIRFLGEVNESLGPAVGAAIGRVASAHRSFRYWLNGLDGFPNKAHPNVIVARAAEEHHAGRDLEHSLTCELKRMGLVLEERAWKPHITLGRNKDHGAIGGLTTLKIEPVVWNIDRLEFIKSELGEGGPKYTVLGSYPLTAPTV